EKMVLWCIIWCCEQRNAGEWNSPAETRKSPWDFSL
ncbi:unnamed protein product, partial [marine sediment metagenome]